MKRKFHIVKTFAPDFFRTDTFLLDVKDFDFLPSGDTRPPCHIAYNVNPPFFRMMGVSVVSVVQDNPDLAVTAHILTDEATQDNLEKVKELARRLRCRCRVCLLDMKPFQDFHIKVERFSRITYGRMVMPLLLQPYTDRFIYIDADAMNVASLKPLLLLDLHGAAMGACSEVPHEVPRRAGYLKLKSGKYFNDGIMVVDVPAWLAQHITERAFAYQKEPKTRFLGQSQDILNLVFDGSNYFLPKRCNEYGGGKAADDSALFIHWTGRRKPWQMVLTRYDALWRHYLDLSPWDSLANTAPVRTPENYHDFKEWGLFQRSQGNYAGFLQGMFWYSVLRIIYKSRL